MGQIKIILPGTEFWIIEQFRFNKKITRGATVRAWVAFADQAQLLAGYQTLGNFYCQVFASALMLE